MDDLNALRDARGGAIKDVGGQEETQCELKYGAETLLGVSLQAITANVIEIRKPRHRRRAAVHAVGGEERPDGLFHRVGRGRQVLHHAFARRTEDQDRWAAF